MYQIDNSSAAVTQPASTLPGTPGFFTDGSAGGGIAATIVPAEWLNATMMELVNVVEAAGFALSKSTFTQLRDAINVILQAGGTNYAVDTGTANVYAVAFTPSVTAIADGLKLRFKAKTANTGASTFSPNGLTAHAIVGGAHAALQGGEIVANGDIEVTWNSTLNAWVLLEQTGGGVQVPNATSSQQAMPLGQATGRLLRTTIYSVVGGSQQVSVNGGAFTTTGATTFSSQALTTLTKVKVLAGGGGGGGAASTGAGQSSCAGGGGAGGYVESIIAGTITAYAVVVTAGGAGGVAGLTSGSPGGNASFGPTIAATGGGGGSPGATASAWPVLAGAGAGGLGSGGLILNARGAAGGTALNLSALSFASGPGGASPFGGGGAGVGTTANGTPAVTPGAGGSGGASLASNAAGAAGGAGAGGYIEVEEYC
jgi:hypothetical protein